MTASSFTTRAGRRVAKYDWIVDPGVRSRGGQPFTLHGARVGKPSRPLARDEIRPRRDVTGKQMRAEFPLRRPLPLASRSVSSRAGDFIPARSQCRLMSSAAGPRFQNA